MYYENKFFAIASHCTLKRLEEPCLYDIENDELYELGEEAYQFLLKCTQGDRPSIKKTDEEFIQYCLNEHLITLSDKPIRFKRSQVPSSSPIPSLRYLELQLTDRCNLQCRHCYLGQGRQQDLPFEQGLRILKEFGEMQGLRLLLSGGEPLLHPQFWRVNDLLRNYDFRSVLLSNGTLITKKVAKRLQVHEVQVSLDGMKEGHESLRGRGTFRKALTAVDYLHEAGIQVSVATMIHKDNLKEFDSLVGLLQSKEIKEWNVDVPCMEGRLKENENLCPSPAEAGPLLNYGFGGGMHTSKENYCCGAHLCAIMPNGHVAKCGLFSQDPVGFIDEGLRVCWERIPRIQLKELTCNCSLMEECRGGCRYRAKLQGGILDPDLFQCYARGVGKGGELDDDQESS
jgi:radical SAM protein with 4Fe4S-binding SPASM domain